MTRTVTVTCPWCNQDHDINIEINNNAEECKYPTDSGPCSREVEEGYCWQHESE